MSDSEGESGADGDAMSMLQRLLMQMRLMQRNGDDGDEQQPQEQQPPPVLESPDLDCLVRHWTAGECTLCARARVCVQACARVCVVCVGLHSHA